ncbi:MAG: 30S ribosomal protein S15, partial [Nitrososphaera sp.]
MARIHVHTHGKSHSIRPTSKSSPSWLTQSPDQISALVVKMSKEGLGPSEIGMKLRDEHAVPLVKSVTGKTLTQVLADNNVKLEMPEDLE